MHVVHELNTSHLNFQMCKCEQIGLLEKLTQRREKNKTGITVMRTLFSLIVICVNETILSTKPKNQPFSRISSTRTIPVTNTSFPRGASEPEEEGSSPAAECTDSWQADTLGTGSQGYWANWERDQLGNNRKLNTTDHWRVSLNLKRRSPIRAR